MTQRILIVGGTGQIGLAVARDLFQHTTAELILTGRDVAKGAAVAAEFGHRGRFALLDLTVTSVDELAAMIVDMDLVIQCAGPFRTLPPTLLAAAIVARVNYVDICDDRRATEVRLGLHEAAQAAGVTALIDTGTFPGIDNVMAAEGLARFPDADDVRLHFVCAGSGNGGYGVLETTFIAVSSPYEELVDGAWRLTPSYRGRQVVDFGSPLGKRPVYNFEVPELWSLAATFPRLRRCTSKFGTIPELWNWSTVALASAPVHVRTDPKFIGDSVTFMLPIVHWFDRWTGGDLGIRVEVRTPAGEGEALYFYAPSTSAAVGWATGAAACMVLDGTIREPGVHLPETHIPPDAYRDALTRRGGRFWHTALASP